MSVLSRTPVCCMSNPFKNSVSGKPAEAASREMKAASEIIMMHPIDIAKRSARRRLAIVDIGMLG